MDLALISGAFFYDDVVPKDKRYLFKYFTGDSQRRFIAYLFALRDLKERHGTRKFHRGFIDHTGFQVTLRVVHKWIARIKEIEAKLLKATESFDFEEIERIRTGKFHFRY